MKITGWWLIALAVGAGVSCGNNSVPAAGGGEKKASSGSAGSAVKYKTVQCLDKQGIGIEAFRMLIPSDWRFSGGVNWILDNPAMPATAAFQVSAPSGGVEFEVFPNLAFFSTDNQMVLMNFPPGSRYFGSEVRPVVGPLE
ncbi:MAG: hypothetical protein NTV79_03075, partial [Candidatus Aureabacteria bacterium]|nr:hypothetical protein [Candidatus Auribacterota bacterium]